MAVLHAVCAGQSPADEQPQVPVERHWCPRLLAVQVAQAAPEVPQTSAAVPAEQVPCEQQPPLQAEWPPSPQALSQAWLTRLQALPAGQSVALLQPQTFWVARQTRPRALERQSEQTAPCPQAASAAPAAQLPELWPEGRAQQPARQALAALQAKLHSLVDGLQPALLAGQFAFVLQPHFPPPATAMHWLPAVSA